MIYTGPQGRAQTLSPDIVYSPMPTDRHIADKIRLVRVGGRMLVLYRF